MELDGPLIGGRWKLGPRLGSGAQGRTFLARDQERDGAVVVVKELRLAEDGWKKFDLYEREVETLRGLDHPGIPKLIASLEGDKGTYYLVMQRAPGATLKAWAKKHRLGEADLRDILTRALDILEYLHDRSPPVIHRDIKPANMVRDRDGALSLVDFGGVRNALRPDGGSTMVGTFGYMAPEQLHGQASPATDIYALGATIVALAGGVEPEEVPRQGLRMDLERHLPHMDRDLRRVLTAMTAPDPSERPQSASAVRELLAAGKRKRRKSKARSRPLPARRPPSALATPGDAGIAHRVVGEIQEMTAQLPGPLRVVARVFSFIVGATGFVGLALIRLAFLPILFALIGAFARDSSRPKIDRARRLVGEGVDEARAGFGALALGRGQLPDDGRDDDD